MAVAGGALTLGGAAVSNGPVDLTAHNRTFEAALGVDLPVAGSSGIGQTRPAQGADGSSDAPISRPATATPEPTVLDAAALREAVQQAGEEAVQQRRAPAERQIEDVQRPSDEDPRAEDGGYRHAEPDAVTPYGRKLAEKAERSVESPPIARDCGVDTGGLGRVKPHVRVAAELLGCRFNEPEMYGVAGRGGPSDHPRGLAVDFMVNRATGDALAACALRNKEVLGINYVIWRQRMNDGTGWKTMPDRGGATANHMDHVHASFRKSAGGTPSDC